MADYVTGMLPDRPYVPACSPNVVRTSNTGAYDIYDDI
jgi:hypothetical protein